MTTIAQAKLKLRDWKIVLQKKDGEYRVTFADIHPAEREASAYYTNDIEDAVDTGIAMRRRVVDDLMARLPRPC